MDPPSIFVVLGSTGTRKSQLAIELAQRFNGEVISVDSMQVYEGLDLITNKVTSEEMKMTTHHLIGCCSPLIEYDVVKFRADCLRLIDEIVSRGKVPILAGGTNYYVQAVLFRQHLVSEEIEVELENIPKKKTKEEQLMPPREASQAEREQMYSKLQRIDPLMANFLHPNDHRKIARSIEVFEKTGRRHSEVILEKQAAAAGGQNPLRYRACVFWLTADFAALDRRLDARIDKMIEQGLFTELREMRDISKKTTLGNTQGIFQSIGYKEFDALLRAEEEGQGSGAIQKLRLEGIEAMKRATRRYARRQVHWVKTHFLALNSRDPNKEASLHVLNTTELSPGEWKKNVWDPASEIATKFLAHQEMPDPRTSDWAKEWLQVTQEDQGDLTEWKRSACEVCGGKVLNGERERQVHFKSRSHKKRLAGMHKRKRNEEVLLAKKKLREDASGGPEAGGGNGDRGQANDDDDGGDDDGGDEEGGERNQGDGEASDGL